MTTRHNKSRPRNTTQSGLDCWVHPTFNARVRRPCARHRAYQRGENNEFLRCHFRQTGRVCEVLRRQAPWKARSLCVHPAQEQESVKKVHATVERAFMSRPVMLRDCRWLSQLLSFVNLPLPLFAPPLPPSSCFRKKCICCRAHDHGPLHCIIESIFPLISRGFSAANVARTDHHRLASAHGQHHNSCSIVLDVRLLHFTAVSSGASTEPLVVVPALISSEVRASTCGHPCRWKQPRGPDMGV